MQSNRPKPMTECTDVGLSFFPKADRADQPVTVVETTVDDHIYKTREREEPAAPPSPFVYS